VAFSVRRDDLSGYGAATTLFRLTSLIGFHFCMRAMLCRVPIVRPAKLAGEAGALQRMGVDYVVASPAQIDALCRGPAPASRMGTLWVIGAIMAAEAVRHWLSCFERVMLMYGTSEIGVAGGLTLTEIEDRTEIAYALLPGIMAEIVGEEGQPLPHSIPGIVRLRAPAMVPGYVGEPDADAEMFRDGWFYPGDIGMLTAEGRLKILGRSRDQINLGGVKFNAAEIDLAARSVQGVRDAMCFTTPSATGLQRLSLCAVKDPDRDPAATASAIRATCRARIRGRMEVSAIYFVDAVPRNESGKAVRGDGARTVMDRSAF
jgi:acyl-coenzyme A synthetase/AMP-(fatty) acid ligase